MQAGEAAQNRPVRSFDDSDVERGVPSQDQQADDGNRAA
jgi:hypothetical protein